VPSDDQLYCEEDTDFGFTEGEWAAITGLPGLGILTSAWSAWQYFRRRGEEAPPQGQGQGDETQAGTVPEQGTELGKAAPQGQNELQEDTEAQTEDTEAQAVDTMGKQAEDAEG